MLTLEQIKTLATAVQADLDSCPNHAGLIRGAKANPTIHVKPEAELDGLTHVYYDVGGVHIVHRLLDAAGTVKYDYRARPSR